jgi:hypothetical protein
MQKHVPATRRNVSIAVLTSLLVFFAFGPALLAVEATVGLTTADPFAVLSGQSISNSGPTTITGDVGIHPGSSVTGFGSVTLNGDPHYTDAVAEQAKVDLVTAYNDAASRGPATLVPTELGGQNLVGGVYDSGSGTFEITTTLILDGEGNPDTVWIFQMASSLNTLPGSSVSLINEAQACNVFWQVGTSATLGTTTSFKGTIMALESISLNTAATVEGRVLARDGSVTLLSNTITRPVCSTPDGGGTTTTTTSGGTTTTTLAPPGGGVGTGGGSTSGAQSVILLLGGFSLLALAVGAFEVRRRLDRRSG